MSTGPKGGQQGGQTGPSRTVLNPTALSALTSLMQGGQVQGQGQQVQGQAGTPLYELKTQGGYGGGGGYSYGITRPKYFQGGQAWIDQLAAARDKKFERRKPRFNVDDAKRAEYKAREDRAYQAFQGAISATTRNVLVARNQTTVPVTWDQLENCVGRTRSGQPWQGLTSCEAKEGQWGLIPAAVSGGWVWKKTLESIVSSGQPVSLTDFLEIVRLVEEQVPRDNATLQMLYMANHGNLAAVQAANLRLGQAVDQTVAAVLSRRTTT